MRQAIEAIMFMAWLLCGCSVEQICDDWRACVVFVIALIVAILSAVTVLANTMTNKNDPTEELQLSTGA